MRKQEQKQWQYLARVMAPHWDATRHEDRLQPDAPDLSFAMRGVDGWLELKTIPAWPKKPTTGIRLAHLRPGQVNWIERRGAAGSGRVSVLLAVGIDPATAEWLLVPWNLVRLLQDGARTQQGWKDSVLWATGRTLSRLLHLSLAPDER